MRWWKYLDKYKSRIGGGVVCHADSCRVVSVDRNVVFIG